jgi:hypothetical protein
MCPLTLARFRVHVQIPASLALLVNDFTNAAPSEWTVSMGR